MAIKNVFQTKGRGTRSLPPTDTTTSHGTKAYKLSDRHALAQYAATGTMNGSFYATADEQLDTILKLADKVDSEFLLKTAVYSRKTAFMKDVPALLLAIVAARGYTGPEFKSAFKKVVNNGRMLRNFVQVIRSGKLGRSSFGSSLKKLIQNYITDADSAQLFKDSIGNDPTLADIIRMVHPKPTTASQEALFGYLLDKEYSKKNLPTIVKQFESFKAGKRDTVPDVDFRMLSSLPLETGDWKTIAQNMSWHALRMNLNTLERHGVFTDKKIVTYVANKLRDPAEIKRAKVFPYQLMMAFRATTATHPNGYRYGEVPGVIPREITEALQDALDISLDNVPELPGNVVVAVDVSGSMQNPVTGSGPNASQVRNVEVASLIAAAILRKNRSTLILPFAIKTKPYALNPRDSVITNAQTLAGFLGGGTNCSAPLRYVNHVGAKVDTFIFVSDNESWLDNTHSPSGQSYTAMQAEWNKVKARNPKAKLVCIDISPNGHTQAKDRADVLNIGGFSDAVFDLLGAFVDGGLDSGHWVSIIEGVTL